MGEHKLPYLLTYLHRCHRSGRSTHWRCGASRAPWSDFVANDEIRSRTEQPVLSDIICSRFLVWSSQPCWDRLETGDNARHINYYDYVLPHQRLWTFDVLICPLRRQSVSCCSRSSVEQSSIARHCCPLSPSSAVVLNHIFSHFLIPLSESSLICTVPAQ